MTSELKIFPEFFVPVLLHEKTFEVRSTLDRSFYIGDQIRLREWDGERYTGRDQWIEITYVSNYEQKDNFAVFSFKHIREGKCQT